MELSDKIIQKVKDILEEKQGKEVSWEEAEKVAADLAQFARIALEVAMEEDRKKQKLKESPKGFLLDGGGYNCSLCGNLIQSGKGWYDKWGIKCEVCQQAVDQKLVPPSLIKNKESWYSAYDLDSTFDLKGPALRRFIKEGIIKERTILNDKGKTHFQLFLIKDNAEFLPPKRLVKQQMVKEMIDGKEYFTWKPWYYFVDPIKHLKKYKISSYFQVVKSSE